MKGTCEEDRTTHNLVCKCTTKGWAGDQCQTATCKEYETCPKNSDYILLQVNVMMRLVNMYVSAMMGGKVINATRKSVHIKAVQIPVSNKLNIKVDVKM